MAFNKLIWSVPSFQTNMPNHAFFELNASGGRST